MVFWSKDVPATATQSVALESEGAADPLDLPPVATDDELRDIETLRSETLAKLGWEVPDQRCAALFRREALVRYLRARKSIGASATMLANSCTWRTQEIDLDGAMVVVGGGQRREL